LADVLVSTPAPITQNSAPKHAQPIAIELGIVSDLPRGFTSRRRDRRPTSLIDSACGRPTPPPCPFCSLVCRTGLIRLAPTPVI